MFKIYIFKFSRLINKNNKKIIYRWFICQTYHVEIYDIMVINMIDFLSHILCLVTLIHWHVIGREKIKREIKKKKIV